MFLKYWRNHYLHLKLLISFLEHSTCNYLPFWNDLNILSGEVFTYYCFLNIWNFLSGALSIYQCAWNIWNCFSGDSHSVISKISERKICLKFSLLTNVPEKLETFCLEHSLTFPAAHKHNIPRTCTCFMLRNKFWISWLDLYPNMKSESITTQVCD